MASKPSTLEPPVLVLTGAGISAESGVPTFRGEDGLWRRYAPEQLATPEAFARDPRLVWEWYAWRRERVAACEPNAAHRVLVEMEDALEAGRGSRGSPAAGSSGQASGLTERGSRFGDRASGSRAPEAGFTLVTQNVDGLHEAAGSRNVLRLHGSIWRLRCTREGRSFEDRRVPLPELPPVCPECGALLRPDVVWFGERLDPEVIGVAFHAAEESATALVIGTSGLVQPAASLPMIALRSGAQVIEVNPEPTPLSPHANAVLRGPAAVDLPRWWRELRG
jgi:NAD-dependent deacetylase